MTLSGTSIAAPPAHDAIWTAALTGATFCDSHGTDLTMLPEATLTEAESRLAACRSKGILPAAAQSCTSGLIAATLTAVAGSSDVVDHGFVIYSNATKAEMIGVPMPLIGTHGAVSGQVAAAMASGAFEHARRRSWPATELAGHGGGSPDNPAGLACLGLARTGTSVTTARRMFAGDRTAIRAAAVAHALKMIRAEL